MEIPAQVTSKQMLDSFSTLPLRTVIRIVASPDKGACKQEIELGIKPVVFGRSVKGVGQLADGYLSRQHFEIRKGRDGQLTIEDLNSSNGTYLNGSWLAGKAVIEHGDIVAAGATVMVVDKEVEPDLLPARIDADPEAAYEIVGESFFSHRLRQAVATVAPTEDPVLLLGPSGAGKEVTAQAIHRLSGRSGPMISVNCAAIPVELAEAELFGHKKGAFTGAETDRPGLFVQADGGTLFLDEVGELPAVVQAKLLRTLEDSVVQPVGGGEPRAVNVRIVAATNADLNGPGFREDLLARLEDWTLHLLPLKRRRPDVMPLLKHFLGAEPVAEKVRVIEALLLHDWALNAREVRKIARRVIALSGRAVLSTRVLPGSLVRRVSSSVRSRLERPSSEAPSPARKIERSPPGREELDSALGAAAGNVSKVAASLGCDRKQVYRWMNRLGLSAEQYR